MEKLVAAALPGAQIEAVDIHGTGDHFELTVVAEQFEGCSLVERHRMVYGALGDAMSGPIHALTIRALTPAQYQDGLIGNIDRS